MSFHHHCTVITCDNVGCGMYTYFQGVRVGEHVIERTLEKNGWRIEPGSCQRNLHFCSECVRKGGKFDPVKTHVHVTEEGSVHDG